MIQRFQDAPTMLLLTAQDKAGGIAAYASNTNITDCTNTGSIQGSWVAGIIADYTMSQYRWRQYQTVNTIQETKQPV
jgi:hypothetical protein